MADGVVTFECEDAQDADVMRRAAHAYGRVLRERGEDLRNYAPANESGAGFGWDAVKRAANDMHTGSRTVMSRRIAGGLRDALAHVVRESKDRESKDRESDTWSADDGRRAFRMMNRLDALGTWPR